MLLVTGATGLIGRRLLRELPEAVVWTRRPDFAARLFPGAQICLLEPQEPRLPEALLPRISEVVHLAGRNIGVRWSEARKREFWESRVTLTERIVAYFREVGARPRVWIQMSATGFYGDRGSKELTEESAPGSDFLARLCRAWEAASLPLEEMGVRRVVFRCGVVLSGEGGALARMLPAFRLGVGGPVPPGTQFVPWIHRSDVAAALLWARNRGKGVYNLVAPAPVTQKQLAETLGALLRRPARLPVPLWALRMLLGEGALLLQASQRVRPLRLEQEGFRWRYPTLREALEAILQAVDP